MLKKYKIADIRKALDFIEQTNPERNTLNFPELEKITSQIRIPLIYNIDELIQLMSDYIIVNCTEDIKLYRESEVCCILKVKKLALHQWRKKGYIKYYKIDNKAIRYDLEILLDDLKTVRDKKPTNISFDSQWLQMTDQ